MQRWRRRADQWALPVAWTLLPLMMGPSLATSLDPRDPGFRTSVSAGLWLVWGGALAAMAVPRTVTLTASRIVAPAALVAATWAAAVTPGSGIADALSVFAAAAVVALAFAPGTGDAFANGSSYGHERRFPLRAPGALLMGPVQLAWAMSVAGAVAGPLLLAAHQWWAGLVVTAVGWPACLASTRALHGLSRRWLVLTPAGVVVHDPMVLLDAVLVLRRHLDSVRPAPVATPARDLTMGAFGVMLEIDLTEPIGVTPRPLRRRGRPGHAIQSEEVTAVLVAPTRPGLVLLEAAARGLPVSAG